jgi:N-acetylglucosaminyldiphosphoundecaprenol N-acetyl-beta-D-mannosaminyltransferase
VHESESRTAQWAEGQVTAVEGRPLVFLAWGSVAGRSRELADALGGDARCFFPMGQRWRVPAPVRYLLAACATGLYLARHRPRLVIVTNPPVPGAVVTSLFARAIGAEFALDSHPGGFGAQGDGISARLQRAHRFLVARAAFVIVADESWSDQVRSWGGVPVVVHEAPGQWRHTPPIRHQPLRVLVASTFSVDEPLAEVLAAARRLPGVDFVVTGDPGRCSATLRRSAPDNVRFAGFLDPAAYAAEVEHADVVVTLTTEPTSVMRAACEAIYAGRPVIVSDWPTARRQFPFAIHTANDAASLVSALCTLAENYQRYADRVDEARSHRLRQWERQLDDLTERVDMALPPVRTDPVRLMGLALHNLSQDEVITQVLGAVKRAEGGRLVNLNVDILRQAVADRSFGQLIADADLVLADGMPIVWASRLLGTPLVERVPASEMIWSFSEAAARNGVRLLLLGGSPGAAERAAQVLSERCPGLRVDSYCPPYGFETSRSEMAQLETVVERTAPDVVFCGFGAPKQERLMASLAKRWPEVWFIACGGTFSMVAGDLPKAPRWMRQCSLEWLHRLRLEPRRLFRRYVICDLPFALRLFAWSAAARIRRGPTP